MSVNSDIRELYARVQALEANKAGGGIDFDVSPQEGDWLEVSTTSSGGTTNAGISLRNSDPTSGTGIELVTIGGDLQLLSNGDGSILIDTAGGTAAAIAISSDGTGGLNLSNSGPGGLNMNESGSSGIFVRNQGAGGLTLRDTPGAGVSPGIGLTSVHNDITLSAGGNVISPTVLATTSDPGVSGALWNSGGFVAVSP